MGGRRGGPAASGGDFELDIGDPLENLEFTLRGNVIPTFSGPVIGATFRG